MTESGAQSLPAGLVGVIEGGGTKFVCAVGRSPDRVVARERIETRGPEETMGAVAQFLERAAGSERLSAIGFACFGPLELDRRRPAYGRMLATPKPGWSDAPLIGLLRERFGVPVELDTDVNAAALAEWRWGAARGCDPALYLTVGTGIGGGAVVGGAPLRGLMHPEMGHIPVPRLSWPNGKRDDFPGVCRFHGACLEGLASGPALEARLGAPAESVGTDHSIWQLEAGYLAHALAAYTLILSPQRIVLGGGVAQQPLLLPLIRNKLADALNGYVARE